MLHINQRSQNESLEVGIFYLEKCENAYIYLCKTGSLEHTIY